MAAKTVSKPPTSLAALREKMSKKYGEDRITRRDKIEPYRVTSTGSLDLDMALVVGGWVEGRIHEIVGQEGTSKTTLAITSMAAVQKKYPDLACGYIDMEHSFDWNWAEANGLDTSDDRFMHVFPDDSEDVSDQIKEMMETGLFKMIVVDSIGGMESKQAFGKDAEEHVMGRNAQVITRMSKRLAVLARNHQCTVLLINQYRANLSSPQGGDQSAGPKAMKYATTTKVETRRAGGSDPLKVKFPWDENPQIVGIQFAAKVSRNKCAPAGRTGKYYLINQQTAEYGPVGIDQASEALAVGLLTGVIEQAGAYYSMPWTEDKKDRIKSRASVLECLRENPERVAEVRDAAVATMAHEVVPERLIEFETDNGVEQVDPTTGEVR